MKLSYIIMISLHNLMDRKIRSILTISGVIIGVGAIVFLLSIGYGFERMTTEQISSPNALTTFDVTLDDSDLESISDKDLAKMQNISSVSSVEPALVLAGKASNGSVKTDVAIHGFSTAYMDLAETKVFKGERFKDNGGSKILISTGALELLNIDMNDFENANISADVMADQVISPTLTSGELKEIKDLKISGIIDDDKTPFMVLPLNTLKKEMDAVNYSKAKVKVDDKEKVSDARREIEEMGFSTNFIGDTVKQINSFFNIFRYIIGGFGVIAMIVAILGMFNTLTVSLMERTQEIGILKSNGAQKKDIWRLFISEAIIISFVGGILGVVTGSVIGETVNTIFNIYAQKNGGEAVDFFFVPIGLVVEMIIIVLFIGIITGFYPARRASKIKILDAIKYE